MNRWRNALYCFVIKSDSARAALRGRRAWKMRMYSYDNYCNNRSRKIIYSCAADDIYCVVNHGKLSETDSLKRHQGKYIFLFSPLITRVRDAQRDKSYRVIIEATLTFLLFMVSSVFNYYHLGTLYDRCVFSVNTETIYCRVLWNDIHTVLFLKTREYRVYLT